MDIIEKVNQTRYTLKEILSTEWDTDTITDYSNQEIEKMYSSPSSKDSVLGVATGCNFTIRHKMIPSHRLHIIYYNFPEIGRLSSKINKSCCDKIYNLYKGDLFNKEDSVFIIINEKIFYFCIYQYISIFLIYNRNLIIICNNTYNPG